MSAGRPTFALSPTDVALLGGVPPSEQDVDAANAAACRMDFKLDWSRAVVPTGMAWVLTVETPRGRFQCSANSEESWHDALKGVGLVDG